MEHKPIHLRLKALIQMQYKLVIGNRRERILFAQKKRAEGYSINDIALLLHSVTTTIQKYLSTSENDLPIKKENARERQHIQTQVSLHFTSRK
jgi:hypothetical protein